MKEQSHDTTFSSITMPLTANSFYGAAAKKQLETKSAHRMTYRAVLRSATGWPALDFLESADDTSSILYQEYNKQAQAVSHRCELIGWSSQFSPNSSAASSNSGTRGKNIDGNQSDGNADTNANSALVPLDKSKQSNNDDANK